MPGFVNTLAAPHGMYTLCTLCSLYTFHWGAARVLTAPGIIWLQFPKDWSWWRTMQYTELSTPILYTVLNTTTIASSMFLGNCNQTKPIAVSSFAAPAGLCDIHKVSHFTVAVSRSVFLCVWLLALSDLAKLVYVYRCLRMQIYVFSAVGICSALSVDKLWTIMLCWQVLLRGTDTGT